MTSNEEHWLMLVKAIDGHFNLIAQGIKSQLREPLLTTPLWEPINSYLTFVFAIHV